MNIDQGVLNEIRRAYAEEPWTTAAGLGDRFGVGAAAGKVAVTGRGLGLPNLAAARLQNAEAIQGRIGDRGRVRPEPALARASGGALTHRDRSATARNSAARWAKRRAAEAARHRALKEESLIGASARAGALARWARHRAAQTKEEPK